MVLSLSSYRNVFYYYQHVNIELTVNCYAFVNRFAPLKMKGAGFPALRDFGLILPKNFDDEINFSYNSVNPNFWGDKPFRTDLHQNEPLDSPVGRSLKWPLSIHLRSGLEETWNYKVKIKP